MLKEKRQDRSQSCTLEHGERHQQVGDHSKDEEDLRTSKCDFKLKSTSRLIPLDKNSAKFCSFKQKSETLGGRILSANMLGLTRCASPTPDTRRAFGYYRS